MGYQLFYEIEHKKIVIQKEEIGDKSRLGEFRRLCLIRILIKHPECKEVKQVNKIIIPINKIIP